MKKFIFPLILVVFFILMVWGMGMKQTGNLAPSINAIFGKEDYTEIVSANNQLGMKLLTEIGAGNGGNTVISPTSLFMALSMVYNGADGATKEEMAKVLQTTGMDASELSQANASMMSMLHKHSKQIQLNIANSIWLNKDFHFQDDFATNNRDYFNAEIKEIDINDSQSVPLINDWVKKSTNGKIKEIIEAPLDPDLVAVLINAIYFNGKWQYEFDKEQTKEQTFYLTEGTTKKVPLMTLNEKLAYLETEDFQAVSLPYGDGQMSMKIFLPRESSNLAAFQKMLTTENWEKWNSEFTEKKGTVLLPKFQLEYEVILNDPLKNLGMETAFDTRANFSKMVKETDPIMISEVKQKTFIDVNEAGTEAAAATSVQMVKESASIDNPFFIEVNRPFFMAITEEESGTILFMGLISDPQGGTQK
ncbi:serpin family protein [Neobacillus sp. 114]|uniref:serpin family protein n=1 Tax=Neobacillus sp. 114 TaxID=3048535 RepID=UPI0024C37F28|nr:serpin family protein [Neobacillus sp. 114]